jgi:NAD+ diphosphatase
MTTSMEFASSMLLPDDAVGPFRGFFFQEHGVLRKNGIWPEFANRRELSDLIAPDTLSYIGKQDGFHLVCGFIEEDVPAGFELEQLRDVLRESSAGEEERFIPYRASGIAKWRAVKNYCSVCGAKLVPAEHEFAMQCPDCDALAFPRLNPAVITAIIRDGKILLAHNRKFRCGLYSLIAGYIEPGESPEQTVAREIREEVGLEVKNIRYWGGQSWPFPYSLMLGFVAEYSGNEIQVDGVEIIDAGWFTPVNMPDLPSFPSISHAIIDAYLQGKL